MTRGIKQIWLHVTEKSRIIKECCYIFATCCNIFVKMVLLQKKISSKSGNFGTFFFDKTPLYESRWIFFLGHHMVKIHQSKETVELP
jgi:hypothetical protein